MANETLYTNISDARLAEVLTQSLQLALADRFSLFGHPAILNYSDLAGRGSSVLKIPIVSLNGVDRMAAVAENASVTNTSVTNTSATITIARQALQRTFSDLGDLTDSVGLNTQALIDDMLGAALMRFTEQIVNITDDFSSTVGTTTADLDMDDWFSAMYTLTQASVPGPYLAVLYPTQLTDLQNSLRAEGGPIQYRTDAQGMLDIRGPGVAGNLNGVDIITSSLVPTANAGADSAGGMWGAGAIGYAAGSPSAIRGAGEVVFPAGTQLYVELGRLQDSAMTKVTGNWFNGVAIIEDGRGVSIITDR